MAEIPPGLNDPGWRGGVAKIGNNIKPHIRSGEAACRRKWALSDIAKNNVQNPTMNDKGCGLTGMLARKLFKIGSNAFKMLL